VVIFKLRGAGGQHGQDLKLVEMKLEPAGIPCPLPIAAQPRSLLLNKGYDHDAVWQIACDYAMTAHIRCRGDYRAHFWIVANAVALSCKVRSLWLNQYRRILVRWQDLAAPCQAMLQIVCAVTACKVATLLDSGSKTPKLATMRPIG
jgi:hypothetical protein